jgi:sugar lactone lactonase YvrE
LHSPNNKSKSTLFIEVTMKQVQCTHATCKGAAPKKSTSAIDKLDKIDNERTNSRFYNRVKRMLLPLLLSAASVSIAQTISTIAGTGVSGFSGDSGQATGAQLHGPNQLHFDVLGNLYIADAFNYCVRKIDARGVITTVAGSGVSGSSGDGGPATLAQLSYVEGVAVDSRGNIYISDSGNRKIRKVDPNGIITTFAGTGNNSGSTADGVPALSASLVGPYGLTVDRNDNLYIVDFTRVRKVDGNGIITTVAGTGVAGYTGDNGPATSAQLNIPYDVAVDASGNLFIADSFNFRIRKVSTTGTITTVAGNGQNGYSGDGGSALSAKLDGPRGITVDSAGNLYINDQFNFVVRRVDRNGVITTAAGNNRSGGAIGDGGPATSGQINPRGVKVDTAGNLYIADLQNHRIRKVTGLPSVSPLSRRGGIDLDGQGKSALVVSGIVNGVIAQQLTVGRLVNNAFQWTTQPGPGTDFRLIAPIDFAGNGKSDLPLLREMPLNANGQGSAQFWPDFSNAAPIVLRDVKPAWDVQAVGDLDGDGFGDLVWRFRGMSPNIDDQGVSYIWFSNGTAVSQVRKRGGAPLTWTLLGAADLNSDGAADMIYVSPTNTMRALMATPNRTCANLNGGAIPGGFTALKLADFTGQGRGDVLIRNATTGEVRLIGLNATGLTLPPYAGAPDDPNASCTSSTLSITQSNFNIGTADPTWTLYATGDFNGDGIYDIVWKRPDNTLTVWLTAANGGAPTIINNAGTAPANSTALPLQ